MNNVVRSDNYVIKFKLQTERNTQCELITDQEILETLKKVDYYETEIKSIDKRDPLYEQICYQLRFWQNKFIKLTQNF